MLLLGPHKPCALSGIWESSSKGMETSFHHLYVQPNNSAQRWTSNLKLFHDKGLEQSNYHQLLYQQLCKWRYLQGAPLRTCQNIIAVEVLVCMPSIWEDLGDRNTIYELLAPRHKKILPCLLANECDQHCSLWIDKGMSLWMTLLDPDA